MTETEKVNQLINEIGVYAATLLANEVIVENIESRGPLDRFEYWIEVRKQLFNFKIKEYERISKR
jgi:hypothetical protein